MATATLTPIAALEPGLDADNTSVNGIVTLIWPYASSSQTLSLLLVDPDFRLRRNRGQVRVFFIGASAKAVARAHIASGDGLLLELKGAKWAKDGSAASTPGKGIEWELRFGGKVALQIQRAEQQPISLTINNPTPSPEPPEKTPTPRFSPTYNSHIPTTVQNRQLDAQAWASPAFLKCGSQFAASAYDPFAEEDFLDNERRKRTKFGRGSGQWRFAERTPSPEKETKNIAFDIDSPSRLPAQHRKRDIEVALPTETLERVDIRKVDGSKNGDPILATKDEETASLSPPTPPITNAETAVVNLEVKQAQHDSPAASTPSLASPFPPSRLHDPESDSQDDEGSEADVSDGAALSATSSDFDLGGSTFLRTSKAMELPQKGFDEAGDRSEVDNEISEIPDRESPFPLTIKTGAADEAIQEQQATIAESAHEFLLPDGDDSHPMSSVYDNLQAAQLRSSPRLPSSDQLESEEVPQVRSILSEKNSNEEEQADAIAHNSFLGEERASLSTDQDEEQETLLSDMESVSKEELSDQKKQPRSMQMEIQKAGNPVLAAVLTDDVVDDMANNIANNIAAQGKHLTFDQILEEQHETREPKVEYTETKESAVEIIDLESADEEDIDQIESQRPTLPLYGSLDLDSENKRKPMETMIPRETHIEENTRDLRTSSELQKEPTIEQSKGEFLHTGMRVEKDVIVDDAGPEPQEQETRATEPILLEAPGPLKSTIFEELPSTVPETFVERSPKSQLMTPDDTQQTSFASQPSFTSLQSVYDKDTLPTPRLTQAKSVGVVPSESPVLQLSQEIEVEESSTAKEEILTIRKTRSSPRKGKEEPPTPEKKMLISRKPPTFIEKLKAMRKLSAQSPRRVSESSATSPWFAPKRLSQVVPDSEADSEAEISPERDDECEDQNIASVVQTPNKLRSLAASFKPTPSKRTSQRHGIASMQSSPGYLSPSQLPPPGFRTTISYYVPLTTLTSHFGTTVDVLAMALYSTRVTRATVGPKDYNQTIYITDPAAYSQTPGTPGTPVITAQIFRPNNQCFPIVANGDSILLRDFKVQTFQRQAMLLSTQSSAWAVFGRSAPLDVQIRGPPVELGPEERMFAQGLWRWRDEMSRAEKDILDEKVPREPPILQNPSAIKVRNAREANQKQDTANITDSTDAKIKKEGTEGLGVDLTGSQGLRTKTRKGKPRERSVDMDSVKESTEPAQRVLRPRGARGIPQKSESPPKAITKPSGTVFTGGLGEPDE